MSNRSSTTSAAAKTAGHRGSRAVFLDRDGVLNEEVHLLSRAEQFRLTPGAGAAVRRLNQAGLRVIVITNQSVVARGLCSEAELDQLHDALRALLRQDGAAVDAVYYCPHHRDADLPRYRTDCPDRKPGTGLLLKAAEAFDLRLADCFFVGDQTGDVQTGINAGCTTILVETGFGGRDGKYDVEPDFRCANLAAAATVVLDQIAPGGDRERP